MKWKMGLAMVTVSGWVAAIGLKLGSKADLADAAFLIGLCLLILGVSSLIMKTGFLTPVAEGFKTIGEWMIRRSRSMERTDDLIKRDHDFQAFKSNLFTRITQSTFIMGACSILIAIGILIT
ncbi:DUF3899 domain-containing protein [Bacillus sp. JRC01]|nr:DUF3899 domain-containing protein [Bacillus sp. JRC01]